MKRLFIAILTLAMLLSLCACGKDAATTQSPEPEKVEEPATTEPVEAPADESPTLDELLATAVEIDSVSFYEEYLSNKVKLASQYEGTACLFTAPVKEIETDHITVGDGLFFVNVYLPTDEIIELEWNQYVTVVGILENLSPIEDQLYPAMPGGYTESVATGVSVDFNVGYLSATSYTRTGVYTSYYTTDGSHPQGVCLEVTNDSGNTYFIELDLPADQKENLTNGTEITVDGKLFVNDNTMPYSAYFRLVATDIK